MTHIIDAENMKRRVNEFNRNSPDNKRDTRYAGNLQLETVLMEAHQYNGFNYLYKTDLTGSAETAGIKLGDCHEDQFDGTDPSRVFYC